MGEFFTEGFEKTDCEKISLVGTETRRMNQIKDFDSYLIKIHYFYGTLYVILFLLCVAYQITSCIRKHRMTFFQWQQLSILTFLILLQIFIYFNYMGLGDGSNSNCGFFDNIFFGVSDIYMFNFSILMGFKTYTVFNNMYQFAVKGDLPEKKAKRRNKRFLYAIYAFSIIETILFVFFNTYWTFINRNISTLRYYNFFNRCMQILLILTNTSLFIIATIRIRQTLKFTMVDARQKNLFRTRCLSLSFAIVYMLIAINLVWGLFCKGRRDA